MQRRSLCNRNIGTHPYVHLSLCIKRGWGHMQDTGVAIQWAVPWLRLKLSLALPVSFVAFPISGDKSTLASANPRDTGVCEINTHFDLAFLLRVLTPLPVFQSCRKGAGQQLTKMSVYFRPIALDVRTLVNIDRRGRWGSRMCSTSRMSVYFTDTGASIKGFRCVQQHTVS